MVSVIKDLLAHNEFLNIQWFCYNKFIDVTDTYKNSHERTIWDRGLVSDYNKTTIMQIGMFGQNEFVHKQYNPYSHEGMNERISWSAYEEIPYSTEEINIYFQPLVKKIFDFKDEFVQVFDSDFDYLDIHCYRWNSPSGGIDWHDDPPDVFDLNEREQKILGAKQTKRVGAGSYYVHSTWLDKWHGELMIQTPHLPEDEVETGIFIEPTPNKLAAIRCGIKHRVAKTSNMAADRLSLQIWFTKAIK